MSSIIGLMSQMRQTPGYMQQIMQSMHCLTDESGKDGGLAAHAQIHECACRVPHLSQRSHTVSMPKPPCIPAVRQTLAWRGRTRFWCAHCIIMITASNAKPFRLLPISAIMTCHTASSCSARAFLHPRQDRLIIATCAVASCKLDCSKGKRLRTGAC